MIKKGDTVMVISGRDKGKRGVVEKYFPQLSKAVVSGVNIRKHHLKPSKSRPKGGIAEYPAPFNRSNLMPICPHCSKPSRVKFMFSEDTSKHRICGHCAGSLDKI